MKYLELLGVVSKVVDYWVYCACGTLTRLLGWRHVINDCTFLQVGFLMEAQLGGFSADVVSQVVMPNF